MIDNWKLQMFTDICQTVVILMLIFWKKDK
ncbi:hypothetical protein GA-1p02 [Bacillus phage GA1]|uniref:Uncharacterized protein n=1 Tax=Bacillus phage GA-1 TaxID=2679898 RepID=Q9FZX6_BPGA1|nr:hypothetical protein GA-1p02 [Bacillus phage GA1]CAC21517.1 hypothetical protein [Bacillus phage GA1]